MRKMQRTSIRWTALASIDAHSMSTTGQACIFFSYEGDNVGKFPILSSLNAKSLPTTQPRVQTFNQKQPTGVCSIGNYNRADDGSGQRFINTSTIGVK
ncbi:hypothetical protein LX32DRAFT_638550 [Colletotrichum zoysiae]|uniref:Uncharacterized protein n=1 Tax=Colletotrichum zoysiae TaxID=1216348 RepID=A0AAD9M236_9PEZI|nr:hypothetical protein LX32DRAFT_638550 [Colletotrichum zoysiae]